MPIRIATTAYEAKRASRVSAAGLKAGNSGIFTEETLLSIPADYLEHDILLNYTTHRFQCAIFSIDGIEAGAGIYGFSRVYDIKYGEITSFCFMREAWGRGFAPELLAFICGQLRMMGCSAVHLWAPEGNRRFRRFCEKNGFEQTGKSGSATFNDESSGTVEYMLFI